jgi:hypothetical protein
MRRHVVFLSILTAFCFAGATTPALAKPPPTPVGCYVSIANISKPTSTTLKASFYTTCANTPAQETTYGALVRDNGKGQVEKTNPCSFVPRCVVTLTISDPAGSQSYYFYVHGNVPGLVEPNMSYGVHWSY